MRLSSSTRRCWPAVAVLLTSGCSSDGLLVITLDQAADSAVASLHEDPGCDQRPFSSAADLIGRATFSKDDLGDPARLGLYITKAWQGMSARIEITARRATAERYWCGCTELPMAGQSKDIEVTTTDAKPIRCGRISGGDDGGGQSGDALPGDPTPGDTPAGDSGPGDTPAGDPGPGDAQAGDPAPGDAQTGDPGPGDALAGDAAPGDPGLPWVPFNARAVLTVFYGAAQPWSDGGGRQATTKLRFQVLDNLTACSAEADWSIPRPIDCGAWCPSGAIDDVHALVVSPINSNGRALVAVQSNAGGTDILNAAIIDLSTGETQALDVPGDRHILPGVGASDRRFPFSIGAELLDDGTQVIVASSCDASGSSCGVRVWSLGPTDNDLPTPRLAVGALRWLRVHALGQRVMAVGIDTNLEASAFVFNLSGTPALVGPLLSTNTLGRDPVDGPNVDGALLSSGHIFVFYGWTDFGTRPLTFEGAQFDQDGIHEWNLGIPGWTGAFTSIDVAMDPATSGVTNLPLGIVVQSGNRRWVMAYEEEGEPNSWSCYSTSSAVPATTGIERRTVAMAPVAAGTSDRWMSIEPSTSGGLLRSVFATNCNNRSSSAHDGDPVTILDLKFTGIDGLWFSVNSAPNGIASGTLVTDPATSQHCLPTWTLAPSGIENDRIIPIDVAVR